MYDGIVHTSKEQINLKNCALPAKAGKRIRESPNKNPTFEKVAKHDELN